MSITKAILMFALTSISLLIFLLFNNYASESMSVKRIRLEYEYHSRVSQGLREFNAVQGRADRDACRLLLGLMNPNNGFEVRYCAFARVLEISNNSTGFSDIYSNAIAKAAADTHGMIRFKACNAWSSESSENSIKALLDMVQSEYLREAADRFLLYPGRTFCPGNRCGPDWVLMECMKQLINMGRSMENYKIVENVYLQTESREMKFFLAHVLYRLGGKPDVELLIQAVDKSLSPYVKAEIINDIKEIGDRRALSALRREARGRSFYPKGYEPKDRAYVRECAQAAVTALEKER